MTNDQFENGRVQLEALWNAAVIDGELNKRQFSRLMLFWSAVAMMDAGETLEEAMSGVKAAYKARLAQR